MSLSVHQASVGVYGVGLNAFQGVLDKAGGARRGAQVRSVGLPDAAAAPGHAGVPASGADLLRQRQERRPRGSPAFEAPRLRGQRSLAGGTQGAHRQDARFPRDARRQARSTRARDREIVFPLGPNKMKMQGAELSAAFRAAELLFPPDDGLRHPALRRRRDRQARLPRRRSRHRPRLRPDPKAKANSMSIERIGVGPRMSQAVVHGDTIYLAGQVADKAAGKSVGEQTREILGDHRRPARQGGLRQDAYPLGDDLSRRHQDLRRNERGLGRLGRAGPYARARHRRGQARRAAIHCRDRLHRRQDRRSRRRRTRIGTPAAADIRQSRRRRPQPSTCLPSATRARCIRLRGALDKFLRLRRRADARRCARASAIRACASPTAPRARRRRTRAPSPNSPRPASIRRR